MLLVRRKTSYSKIYRMYSSLLDYVVPPSENNAIFIMTNFIQTDQTRSICPESYSLKEAYCETDSDCQNRPFSPKVNGRWTGHCILSPNVTVFNGTMNITKTVKGLCEYSGRKRHTVHGQAILTFD